MVTRTTITSTKTTQRRTGHENTSRPFDSDRCGHRRFYDRLGYFHDYRWEAGQMNRQSDARLGQLGDFKVSANFPDLDGKGGYDDSGYY